MARIDDSESRERESRGPITRKELAAISAGEIRTFNRDYDRLLDEEQTARAARILEFAREAEFEIVRHVMSRANQTYGGALASGDEIGIQLLRPDHLEMGATVATGVADSWEFTWVATADQDLYGTTGDPIDQDDNAIAEAKLIVGWSTNHASPKTEMVQFTKFGRDLIVQPLAWDLLAAERNNVKVLEANPWFLALPGENFEVDVNVFVIGTDVLRALGIYTSIGTNLRDVTIT